MPNVLVRDLPDDVHALFVRRAESQGLSLQAYLILELTRLAERPSVDELFERIERRTGGRVGFQEAVDAIAEARAERDAR